MVEAAQAGKLKALYVVARIRWRISERLAPAWQT